MLGHARGGAVEGSMRPWSYHLHEGSAPGQARVGRANRRRSVEARSLLSVGAPRAVTLAWPPNSGCAELSAAPETTHRCARPRIEAGAAEDGDLYGRSPGCGWCA